MDKIVECVPNFSEGRDKSVINAISAAVESVNRVKLLNVDPGEDFNRTVYTFVGEPEQVLEAAFRAAKVGVKLIDMTKHKGEHARMGALDVCPFIPIKNVTDDDCIKLSKKFGERMAKEIGVPVFLYAKSATKSERVRLPDIRKGEYEALEEKFNDPSFKPDYGNPIFVPKSGATATGCRDILLASERRAPSFRAKRRISADPSRSPQRQILRFAQNDTLIRKKLNMLCGRFVTHFKGPSRERQSSRTTYVTGAAAHLAASTSA